MKDELSKAYTVAVAGLLHDIGKFLQRAESYLPFDSFDYSYATKNGYGHIHAAYTGKFFDGQFDNLILKFPEIIDADSNTSAANLASMHHKPENAYQWIIAEADRLASGFERVEGKPDEYEEYIKLLEGQEKQRNDKATFKNMLLCNIFSEVNLSEQRKFDSFYPLAELDPAIKPITSTAISREEALDGYKELLKEFDHDLGILSEKANSFSLPNLYNALCSILEKYCWCIPAATVRRKDGRFIPEPSSISLYDHMRSTSAIASALYTYHSDKQTLNKQDITNRQVVKLCFIQGDFSGIQDFIFDSGGESNKSAAKILRAKSFFVSMATEAAAYAVCDKLDIPYSSIVLNAGGKFTIITGNTEKARTAVTKIREEINAEFSKLTFEQTRFNMVGMPFSPEMLTGDNFGNLMGRLARELEKRKLKPVIEQHVFENYLAERDNRNVCSICGKHWGEKQVEHILVCSSCDRFRKIGEKLVKEDFIQFSDSGEFPIFGKWSFSFGNNRSNCVTFDISPKSEFKGFAKKRISNYVPKDCDKQAKTFEEIAKAAVEDGKGTANLAVLKADVDNLGQIFIRGLQNNSISKTATLSRMLDYFFTGWLQERLKDTNIYTVFSGGDDLFLIGAWNEVVALAKDIATHLKTYSGNNPDIHLSAGVILRKPMIPVREMAEDAEDALGEAKKGQDAKNNRNRINIFGITSKWEDFFEVENHTQKIRQLYESGHIAHGLIYRLLGFAENAELIHNAGYKIGTPGDMEAAKWQARFRYLVSRNYRGKENISDIEKLGELISKYRLKAKIPLSIVIYENRRIQ